ncbi:MAG: M20 family metallopeptidase [Aquabacterium sp.]
MTPDDTTATHRALAQARLQRERSVQALAALVRIRSLTGEEAEGQHHLAAHLRTLGATVDLQEPDVRALFDAYPTVAQYPTHWQHDLVLPYETLPTYDALQASAYKDVLHYRDRPNLVARLPGSGGGRSLILNGHIDTVTVEPLQAWSFDPYGATVVDGRMVGRGTSDMKGGLIAAVMALTYLREAGVELRGDVIFQSVVNEEHAGNGTLDLVRRGITADAAIVLEPTHNAVCVDHTGGLYGQVEVRGRPRSPGARWVDGELDGVSAIEKLPAVIDALLEVERDAHARAAANTNRSDARDAGGRAAFSLVIGKIQGGHYETVTAPDVLIKGGAYFAPEVGTFLEVMQRMSAAMDRAAEGDRYLGEFRPRMQFLHHDDAVVQRADIAPARELCRLLERRGGDGRVRPGPFCCDMRHLVNQAGIPSVIFGPGSIAQAHKHDEHILLDEFHQAIEHLIEFIPAWCNQDAG